MPYRDLQGLGGTVPVTVNEAAALLRAGESGAEEDLYAAMCTVAHRVSARYAYVPVQEREDLIQDKVLDLWMLLQDTPLRRPGAEEAWVQECVKNAFIDHLRTRTRMEEANEDTPDVVRPPSLKPLYARYASTVPGKPGDVLEWVYGQGRSPSALVDRMLRHEVEDDRLDPLEDLSRPRKRHRDSVHKRMERGRESVLKHILKGRAELFDDAPPAYGRVLRGLYVLRLSRAAVCDEHQMSAEELARVEQRARAWLCLRLTEAG